MSTTPRKTIIGQSAPYINLQKHFIVAHINPLSANPTKWSNKLKQLIIS